MKIPSSILAGMLMVLLAPGTGAEPYGDGFAGGDLNKYVDASTQAGKIQIEGNTLVLDDTQASIKPVPVTPGTAMRLSFEASFSGLVESIDDNPRLDIFTHPGARNPVLPAREITFLDQRGKPSGLPRLSCMPFRGSHEYVDEFHIPPGAVAMRLKLASGMGIALRVRNLRLERLPTGEGILNLNPDFALGPCNYSGWRSIAGGGTLIDAGGTTVFDSKYGSRGTEFPLAGPGTYALSAKATGNGYNATVHLDIFDATGRKLMRSTVRRFDQTNHFIVPPGATSASLLVYSCLLEEVQVRRVGDANAIGPSPDKTLRIRSDFEGGSVRVIGIDSEKRVVSFMPGGDPSRGWPCWWYFRIEGTTPGESITLRLCGSESVVGKPGAPMQKPISPTWAMPHRATWSGDGTTWQHTGKGKRQDEWMTYTLTPDTSSVFVAWGPPYTPENATRFIRHFSKESPHAEAGALCRSREDRHVPLLHVREGDRPPDDRFGVWIQARQHAWESGSSWVAQGFMEWLLGDTPEAAWLRQHAEVFVVPIMDVDHTATGDGGKDAQPHDHNRDWSDQPIWNEVKAGQKRIRALIADGRMDVFIDLHNPSPGDPTFFFVPDAKLLEEPAVTLRNRFVDLAYKRISRIKPMIPMSSKQKTTGAGYHPLWRQISSNWVALNGNPQTVSLCLETIWNSPNSTTEGYRSVGAALGETVHEFLAERAAARE